MLPTSPMSKKVWPPLRGGVLVVDDDADFCKLIRDYLEEAGLSVVTLLEPLTALEVMKTTRFDVVIADVMLPNLNGITFIRRARQIELQSHTKFIITTGGNLDTRIPNEEKAGHLDSEICGCLMKPFEQELLLNMVEKILPPSKSATVDMKSMKILVVDDEAEILELVAAFLEGFNVIATTDPLHAIEIYKSEDIGLVIADYKMPGLNGLELYAELKKLAQDKPRIPFFYMITSGYDDVTLERRSREAGVNEFFKKPINEEKLRSCVESLLSGGKVQS